MKRTRSPENTARTEREQPERILMEALLFGPSAAIERMERRGQEELVDSDVLPTDTRGADAAFEALGFTFGAVVPGDEMFRTATLPTGWRREGSDHDMWSYVVDERGIRRVAVFYKAASYDRSAFMRIQNVGGSIGSEALYGDAMPTAESVRWGVLTDVERAAFRVECDRMRAYIKESPDIYGKRAANLAACDAIIAADGGTGERRGEQENQ